MIPSSIVLLKAFPLSANGKVDRRSLPQPDQRTLRTMEAYSAPRTTTEEVVADIWGDVLTLRPVGIHDNFFELGGESLLATQVLSRLREAVGVQLLLGTFFEAPTVAGLAEQIEAARKAGAELMPERIPRIARED
jgi:acyl carrier protein